METYTPIYLIYDMTYMTVVEICETMPIITDTGYNYAIGTSKDFKLGDEFSQTIHLSTINENQEIVSWSSVRNNAQAARLLAENAQLKQEKAALQQKTTVLEDYLLEVDFRMILIEMGML